MREVLQTRNRAFGPNGVPTTSRQTSATRTDTTSRLPISLGSTTTRYEPSPNLRPTAIIVSVALDGPAAVNARVVGPHRSRRARGVPAPRGLGRIPARGSHTA